MRPVERAAFAQRLRRASKLKGISQNEIGRRLGNGKATVSNWFTGRTQPDFETFALLCQLLGVSSDQILGLPGAAPPEPEEFVKIRLRCPHCDKVIERSSSLGEE
jgi:transcriptional regulator with XRE-family HTH domain